MQRSSFSGRYDVHQAITARIIEAIEAGSGEFVMPWHRAGPGISRPTNAATGKAYRGGNVVALWAEATLTQYGSGHWATFRQWQGLGASVRKGQHGAPILFFKAADVEEVAVEGGRSGRRLFARASFVFNADQVEGWERPEVQQWDPVEVLPAVEAFIAGTGAAVRHGGDIACYRREQDLIEMPAKVSFTGSPTSTPTEA